MIDRYETARSAEVPADEHAVASSRAATADRHSLSPVAVDHVVSAWRAKESRPEMAPQRLEKIESGPGIGMGSEASNLQDLVHRRGADEPRE